jgi:predicted ribosome quality control (RQC) complex YloA/Tae2 family protein
MALDGIVLSNVIHELNTLLIGGRVDKIAQPEKDEIIISIRNNSNSYKLLVTAQASMPRTHLTEIKKKNPLTPPSFCMLLRKHINNGKIIKINQPNFERIVEIYFEQLNELGDLCQKILIVEIMGRHSNIILCDEDRKILDSIKRIGSQISSVREVYPGIEYTYPPSKEKLNPLETTKEAFITALKKKDILHKAIYQSFNGISPVISEEICYLSTVENSKHIEELSEIDYDNLYNAFSKITNLVKEKKYSPNILLNDDKTYSDFSSLILNIYNNSTISFSSISELMDNYYKNKSNQTRINQKSVDIRKLIQNNLERCYKKLDLQTRQLNDTKNKEKYKIKGELINANLFQIKDGDEKVEVLNYYTNKEEVIKLDPNLSPSANSQKYYENYNKKKRTFIALTEQIEITKKELSHLESIKYSLDFADTEEDIVEIRKELMESGYIKYKKSKGKKALPKSMPLHYISSDGFHIYVGKNNLQNEELSLKFGSSKDWWFHTKEIPGSHVIVKTEGKELPDKTYEEAAGLAAYYSQAKDSSKVTVDYTLQKNLKKPNGSPLGFVIYYTNYSMVVEPNEKDVKKIN